MTNADRMTFSRAANRLLQHTIVAFLLVSIYNEYTEPIFTKRKHKQEKASTPIKNETTVTEHEYEHLINISFFDGGAVRLQVIHPEDGKQRFVFDNADVVLAQPVKKYSIPLKCLLSAHESDECNLSSTKTDIAGISIDTDSSYKMLFESNGSQYSLHLHATPSESNYKLTLHFLWKQNVSSNEEKVLASGTIPIFQTVADLSPEYNAQATMFLPEVTHAYGIPEHSTSFALSDGTYRLYNSDVFKYKLNVKSALYGAVPFILGVSPKETLSGKQAVGFLWLNASETFVSVKSDEQNAFWKFFSSGSAQSEFGKRVEWKSIGGIVDCFLFPGPEPSDVTRQHAEITGFPVFHPLFAFGYHQSRWNYKDEADVLSVSASFAEHNIPLDVLWLDIEHTDDKKYFTWDPDLFPTPDKMLKKLTDEGRYLVTIIDPHIKRESGYFVHDEAKTNGFYVKKKDMVFDYQNFREIDDEDEDTDFDEPRSSSKVEFVDFIGHCWPGSSSWIDFLNSSARKWYASLFEYDRYVHSTPRLHSWIDMNEPSVFGGEEGTMRGDAVHSISCGNFSTREETNGHRFIPHSEVHNLYGFYQSMATYNGLLGRNEKVNNPTYRPFVLSRSFFPGSQRYAAVWTGDNDSTWEHMNISMPMCLSLSVSNIMMCGADVGGFFNDSGKVDTELLTRWYQLGALLYPFFRGHSHHDAPRMEPYLFDDATKSSIRESIGLRYTMLPYMYTMYYHAHIRAEPVMRPLFFEFPQKSLLDIDNAALLGDALLVCPISVRTGETLHCKLPLIDAKGNRIRWYALYDGKAVQECLENSSDDVCTLYKPITSNSRIPAFIRSGSIVPMYGEARETTSALRDTKANPITLRIALPEVNEDTSGEIAEGFLFADDYETMRYALEGWYIHRTFTLAVETGDNHTRRLRIRNISSKRAYKPKSLSEELIDQAGTQISGEQKASGEADQLSEGFPSLLIQKLELWGLEREIRSIYAVSDVNSTEIDSEKSLSYEKQDVKTVVLCGHLRAADNWNIIIELSG